MLGGREGSSGNEGRDGARDGSGRASLASSGAGFTVKGPPKARQLAASAAPSPNPPCDSMTWTVGKVQDVRSWTMEGTFAGGAGNR